MTATDIEKQVTALAIKYCLACQYTSFVAVENRTKAAIGPLTIQQISSHGVDQFTYFKKATESVRVDKNEVSSVLSYFTYLSQESANLSSNICPASLFSIQ